MKKTNSNQNYTGKLNEEIQKLNARGHFFTAEYAFKGELGDKNTATHMCCLTISYKGIRVGEFKGGSLNPYEATEKTRAKSDASRYAYDELKNPKTKIWNSVIHLLKQNAAQKNHDQVHFQFVPKNKEEIPSDHYDPQNYKSPVDFSIKFEGTLSVFIEKSEGEKMTAKAVQQSLVQKRPLCFYPTNKFGIVTNFSSTLDYENSLGSRGVIFVFYKCDQSQLEDIIKLKNNNNDIYVHETASNFSTEIIKIADKIKKE